MFDRNNCRHSVTDISTGKVRVFVFEDTNFSCIRIHNGRKRCLESGQMSTTLCIVDIVAESQYVFAKFIGILKCYFYLNAICLAFQINRLMKRFCTVVHVPDITDDAFRFMVFFFYRFCSSEIFKNDRQFRIQIRSLMKTALDIRRRKTCLFKNLRIRKKIDTGSGFFRPAKFWKESVFQLQRRNTLFIMVVMDISVTAHFDIQISRKCIYHRRTYSMKSTTRLISRIVKFTACMKRRKYQSLRRHSLFVHIYRDSTSVVCYSTGTVLLQNYMDQAAVSCQVFIYCIIHDLVDQMIQSLPGYTSDIHTRTFADRFQSFQNRYTPCIVGFFFRHRSIFLSFLTLLIQTFVLYHT